VLYTRLIYVCALLFLSFPGLAQLSNDFTVESVKYGLTYGKLSQEGVRQMQYPLEEEEKKKENWLYPELTRFVFAFDNRTEWLNGNRGRMDGIKVGMEFNERYRLGVAIYNNPSPVAMEPVVTERDSIVNAVDLRYFAFYGELILYKDYRWEVDIPIAYGTGNASLIRFTANSGLDEPIRDISVRTVDAGISAHYKIFSWVGFGSGFGYRKAFSSNELMKDAYTSPYFVFKLKLFLGYLYKTVFQRKKLKEERDAYHEKKRERKKRRLERRNS